MHEIPTTRPDNKGTEGDCFYMVGNEVNVGTCVDSGLGAGVKQVECWEMESLKGSFLCSFTKS